MALGSNRDYGTWHKTIVNRMKAENHINLWECSECGRKNFQKYSECPRCKTNRKNNEN